MKAANISDIVPNTESETRVSIQGESGEGTHVGMSWQGVGHATA